TSPGFCAWPPGRFSVAGTKAVTSTGRARRAAAATAPITAAPPAMSYFMVSIDLGGLSESPPESKVIPLPTRITRRRAPGPAQRSRMKRGSSRLPRATASRPVRPSLAMRFGAHASASRPRMSRASAATPRALALRFLSRAGTGAPPRIEPDGHGAEPEERDRRLAVMDERLLGLAPEPCGPRPARERHPHPAVELPERCPHPPLRYGNK